MEDDFDNNAEENLFPTIEETESLEYEQDEPFDYILEQQEREDFAQDDEWHNQSAEDVI